MTDASPDPLRTTRVVTFALAGASVAIAPLSFLVYLRTVWDEGVDRFQGFVALGFLQGVLGLAELGDGRSASAVGSAVAAPMPLPPPATTTILPSSFLPVMLGSPARPTDDVVARRGVSSAAPGGQARGSSRWYRERQP